MEDYLFSKTNEFYYKTHIGCKNNIIFDKNVRYFFSTLNFVVTAVQNGQKLFK